MLFHKKWKHTNTTDTQYETCVICGAVTDVLATTPVDKRPDYIVGAGQLCRECAIRNSNEEQAAMRSGYAYDITVYRKKG